MEKVCTNVLEIFIYLQCLVFHVGVLGTGSGGGHCSSGADGLGGSHHLVLQPMGQDPHAAALPARLQGHPAESTWHWCVFWGQCMPEYAG